MLNPAPATTGTLDLVVSGRAFYDLVMSGVRPPEPGGEVFADNLAISPGGAATRAVAAARLGLSTALVAVVGHDRFGDHLVELLRVEPGLQTGWLQQHDQIRTAVSVALTDGHDRSFVTYEDPRLALAPTSVPAFPAVRACHIGLAEAEPAWLPALRRAGTFTIGGIGWDETGRWSPTVLDRLSTVDAFVPNEDEALRYTRTDNVRTATAALAERVGVVCTTRGAAGAFAIDAGTGEQVAVPAPSTTVLDPTGAGDCFVAAFAAGRIAGLDLRTTVALAVVSASLSVARPGGASSAPGRDQLAGALRRGLAHANLPAANWDDALGWLERSGPGDAADSRSGAAAPAASADPV